MSCFLFRTQIFFESSCNQGRCVLYSFATINCKFPFRIPQYLLLVLKCLVHDSDCFYTGLTALSVLPDPIHSTYLRELVTFLLALSSIYPLHFGKYPHIQSYLQWFFVRELLLVRSELSSFWKGKFMGWCGQIYDRFWPGFQRYCSSLWIWPLRTWTRSVLTFSGSFVWRHWWFNFWSRITPITFRRIRQTWETQSRRFYSRIGWRRWDWRLWSCFWSRLWLYHWSRRLGIYWPVFCNLKTLLLQTRPICR